MIRIYLDLNIISSLKLPENEHVYSLIKKHKQYLQFPYSPAHFNDLMKSYSGNNEFFFQDLDTLEYLCENHLIRWEDNRTKPLRASPKEYFEKTKDINRKDISSFFNLDDSLSSIDELGKEFGLGKVGEIFKSTYQNKPIGFEINEENRDIIKMMFPNISNRSSMWDLMKDIGPFAQKLLHDRDYYKTFRRTIRDKGAKLDENSGNWNEDEAINKIDESIKESNVDSTFIDLVESSLKYKKKPAHRFEFFVTAYLLLDMIGYKPDKLPKQTDTMQNISNDAEHAFYGAHCDFFVANDSKLRKKAKALYSKLNIPTVVWSSQDFYDNIEKYIHFYSEDKFDIIEDAFSYIDFDSTVEFYPKSSDFVVDTSAIKLPIFYFNFFNYVIFQYYEDQETITLTYRKVFKNYSNFVYFTEIESLIDRLIRLLGLDDQKNIFNEKDEFIHSKTEKQFIWKFQYGLIVLENEPELGRARLQYIFKVKNTAPNTGYSPLPA